MWRPSCFIGHMAAGNLDLVRSIYERWAEGDYSRIDWAHPEIEFVIADGIGPGAWRGVPEMGRAWGEEIRAWDDFRVIPEEYRELDEERVLVLLHNHGRGKTSGVSVDEIAAKSANVVHLREGRVTRLVLYWDRERALADLGLT